MSEFRAAIPCEVEATIENAMMVFQQAIATQVAESLDKAMEKLEEEFSEFTKSSERLELQIENRQNFDKFQEEVR